MGVFVFVAIGEGADRAREHEPSGDDDRKGDRVAEHGASATTAPANGAVAKRAASRAAPTSRSA